MFVIFALAHLTHRTENKKKNESYETNNESWSKTKPQKTEPKEEWKTVFEEQKRKSLETLSVKYLIGCLLRLQ